MKAWGNLWVGAFVLVLGCGGHAASDDDSETGGVAAGGANPSSGGAEFSSGGTSAGSGGTAVNPRSGGAGGDPSSGGSEAVESCDEAALDCTSESCGCEGGFESCSASDIHCQRDVPDSCVCDPTLTVEASDCRYPSMEHKCFDRPEETGVPWSMWCVCDTSWRDMENPCPPKSAQSPDCRLECDAPTIEESSDCACVAC